jgi:hypothetical protein
VYARVEWLTFLANFIAVGRLRVKCDGTRAETIFLLSAKRTSPFKSAGASVQSTTRSRGVRINGSNSGYTMFRGSVKGTVSIPSFPFTSPPVRHRVPSLFNRTLHPQVTDAQIPNAWPLVRLNFVRLRHPIFSVLLLQLCKTLFLFTCAEQKASAKCDVCRSLQNYEYSAWSLLSYHPSGD